MGEGGDAQDGDDQVQDRDGAQEHDGDAGQPQHTAIGLAPGRHVGWIAATQRHLEILSEIAEMLSDRELRERLKTEADAAKVHELISNWEPLKSVA